MKRKKFNGPLSCNCHLWLPFVLKGKKKTRKKTGRVDLGVHRGADWWHGWSSGVACLLYERHGTCNISSVYYIIAVRNSPGVTSVSPHSKITVCFLVLSVWSLHFIPLSCVGFYQLLRFPSTVQRQTSHMDSKLPALDV